MTFKCFYWLIATVRKNRLCATATDVEISAIAKDWFRFAADREGADRKERTEKENGKRQLTLSLMTENLSETLFSKNIMNYYAQYR